MTPEQLKEQALRAEGYSEGFKQGYLAALQYIAKELDKQEELKKKIVEAVSEPDHKEQ